MSDDGAWTNFYLSGSDGMFKSVNGHVNLGNNKCYLQLPSSMFSAEAGTRGADDCIIDEPEVIIMPVTFKNLDNITGINDAIQRFEVDAFYNLQGQRVDNPGKGVYIKNGRKVIIR